MARECGGCFNEGQKLGPKEETIWCGSASNPSQKPKPIRTKGDSNFDFAVSN
jgi:hypothetical protein